MSKHERAKAKKKLKKLARQNKQLEAKTAAFCVECGQKASGQCRGCHVYLCATCGVIQHKRQYCSDRCLVERLRLQAARERGSEHARARDLRMWIADPFGINLYARLLKGGAVVGVLAILIYGLIAVARSQRQEDIRFRGVGHGVNIQDVTVGDANQ